MDDVIDLLDMVDGAKRTAANVASPEKERFELIAIEGLSHAVRTLVKIVQAQDEKITWANKQLVDLNTKLTEAQS
jgi:hypothetical protein